MLLSLENNLIDASIEVFTGRIGTAHQLMYD